MRIFIKRWEDKKYFYCSYKNQVSWLVVFLILIISFLIGYNNKNLTLLFAILIYLIIFSLIMLKESWFQINSFFKGGKTKRKGTFLNLVWKIEKK